MTWRFVLGGDLDGGAVVPLDSLGRPYSDESKEGFEVTMHRGRGYGFEANETLITLTRETNAVATGTHSDNLIANNMLNFFYPIQTLDYAFLFLAPRTLGWVILGEMEKLVPVSRQRLSQVSFVVDGYDGAEVYLSLALTGAPQETARFAVKSPSGKLIEASCGTSQNGTVTVQYRDSTNAKPPQYICELY